MNGENTRPGQDHAAQDSPKQNPQPHPPNFHPLNLHPLNLHPPNSHPQKIPNPPLVDGIAPVHPLPPQTPVPAPTYSPTEDTTLKYCNGI